MSAGADSLATVPFSSDYGYDTETRLRSIQQKDAVTEAVLFGLIYRVIQGHDLRHKHTEVGHEHRFFFMYHESRYRYQCVSVGRLFIVPFRRRFCQSLCIPGK